MSLRSCGALCYCASEFACVNIRQPHKSLSSLYHACQRHVMHVVKSKHTQANIIHRHLTDHAKHVKCQVSRAYTSQKSCPLRNLSVTHGVGLFSPIADHILHISNVPHKSSIFYIYFWPRLYGLARAGPLPSARTSFQIHRFYVPSPLLYRYDFTNAIRGQLE